MESNRLVFVAPQTASIGQIWLASDFTCGAGARATTKETEIAYIEKVHGLFTLNPFSFPTG